MLLYQLLWKLLSLLSTLMESHRLHQILSSKSIPIADIDFLQDTMTEVAGIKAEQEALNFGLFPIVEDWNHIDWGKFRSCSEPLLNILTKIEWNYLQ